MCQSPDAIIRNDCRVSTVKIWNFLRLEITDTCVHVSFFIQFGIPMDSLPQSNRRGWPGTSEEVPFHIFLHWSLIWMSEESHLLLKVNCAPGSATRPYFCPFFCSGVMLLKPLVSYDYSIAGTQEDWADIWPSWNVRVTVETGRMSVSLQETCALWALNWW